MSKHDNPNGTSDRLSPAAALARLREGNKKFLAGTVPLAVDAAFRRGLVAGGQKPYACIVACSDSRVVPEAIFCAGLGELFVIRTAGNTISESELATVAYAVNHLHVPLIAVMGHTHCGAVEAALSETEDEDVRHIVENIREAIGSETDPRRAERLNAEVWARKIAAKRNLRAEVRSGQEMVLAALYDTETGEVSFIENEGELLAN